MTPSSKVAFLILRKKILNPDVQETENVTITRLVVSKLTNHFYRLRFKLQTNDLSKKSLYNADVARAEGLTTRKVKNSISGAFDRSRSVSAVSG